MITCVSACVGSFWAITGVVRIGFGGRLKGIVGMHGMNGSAPGSIDSNRVAGKLDILFRGRNR